MAVIRASIPAIDNMLSIAGVDRDDEVLVVLPVAGAMAMLSVLDDRLF